MARNNKITDLRNLLFETLEALRNKENPMELDRAKAVVDVAKAITETGKLEVAMVNALSKTARDQTFDASPFFGESEDRLMQPEQKPGRALTPPLLRQIGGK